LNSTKVSKVAASACRRNPLRKQQAILEKIAAIPDVQSASFGNAILMDDDNSVIATAMSHQKRLIKSFRSIPALSKGGLRRAELTA
jgi:hypothetical protein